MNPPSPENEDGIAAAQSTLDAKRRRHHPHCVVCSHANRHGLRLTFAAGDHGSVSAVFPCANSFEGYAGVVHGGIISSLLDGAMTNCLFARGIAAVTAELTVRFRRLLRIGERARVRAWITRSTPHLYFLAAEITQSGKVAATAQAKFRRLQNPIL